MPLSPELVWFHGPHRHHLLTNLLFLPLSLQEPSPPRRTCPPRCRPITHFVEHSHLRLRG
ncbi:hypothetical protein GYH30_039443 [Glycine max]|nr:hypothetical protein GYH30_039443 [Glycine max]